MIGGVGYLLLHRAIGFGIGARDQQAVAAGSDALRYDRDLLRRLSLAENYLRKAGAEGAVMVELSEPNVFVGEVSQAGERLVNAECAPLQGLEKLL